MYWCDKHKVSELRLDHWTCRFRAWRWRTKRNFQKRVKGAAR